MLCETIGVLAASMHEVCRTHLCLENELGELGTVDPVDALQHAETAQHPPRVADVLQFFRTTVESSVLELSLAQPPSQLVCINVLLCAKDGQRSDAHIHLCRMTLASWRASESAIKVAAPHNVLRRLFQIQAFVIQSFQQTEAVERTKDESSVCLSPGVAAECSIRVM